MPLPVNVQVTGRTVLDARSRELAGRKRRNDSNSHKSFFEKRDHLSEKTTLT